MPPTRVRHIISIVDAANPHPHLKGYMPSSGGLTRVPDTTQDIRIARSLIRHPNTPSRPVASPGED